MDQVSERQFTFDDQLARQGDTESRGFLVDRFCTGCGKPLTKDQIKAGDTACYWCNRLRLRKKGGHYSGKK